MTVLVEYGKLPSPQEVANMGAEQYFKLISKYMGFSPTWMSQMRPFISESTLENICLPRAHDAGLFEPVQYRRLGTPSTTITQEKTILEQLALGVRRFDLRPCIVNGRFFCGHYEYIRPDYVPAEVRKYGSLIGVADDLFNAAIGWYSGGEGVSLDDVVSQVNQFTSQFPGELIILEVSHLFNFDREVHNQEWAHELDQNEFNRLTSELSRLDHLYISEDGPDAALTKIKLGELLKPGQSAVVVVTSPAGGITLEPARAGKGFFNSSILDPLRSREFHMNREQEPLEAVCGFLRDRVGPFAAKLVATFSGTQSPYLKDGLWSIKDVAHRLIPQKLAEVKSSQPAGGCWTCISADCISDLSLLAAATSIIAKSLKGDRAVLKIGNEGEVEITDA